MLDDVVVVHVWVGHERLGAAIKRKHRGRDFVCPDGVGTRKLTQPVLDVPGGVVQERDRGTGSAVHVQAALAGNAQIEPLRADQHDKHEDPRNPSDNFADKDNRPRQHLRAKARLGLAHARDLPVLLHLRHCLRVGHVELAPGHVRAQGGALRDDAAGSDDGASADGGAGSEVDGRHPQRAPPHLRRAQVGVVVHRGVGVDLEHVKVRDADESPNLGAPSHPRAHHPQVDPEEAIGHPKDAKPANLHSLVRKPPSDVHAAPQRVQTGLQATEHGPLEHHGHDREQHKRNQSREYKRHKKRHQAQVVKVFILRINPSRPDDDGDWGVVADVVHEVHGGVKPVDAERPHVEENCPAKNLLHRREDQQRQ